MNACVVNTSGSTPQERLCRAGGAHPAVGAADPAPGLAFRAAAAAFPTWCLMPFPFPRAHRECVAVAGGEH